MQEKLEQLARCHEGVVLGKTAEEQKAALDKLHHTILTSDNLPLISVYKRAIRNHDTLYPKLGAKPVPSLSKHHQPLKFTIPETHLTLDVNEDSVLVKTQLKVKRISDETTLILDGREHVVDKVFFNGEQLAQDAYIVTAHELIFPTIPTEDSFTVEVHSRINPFNNDSMEGLYKTGQWLSTQCESEGARRIFYTIDRPDCLSKYIVTLIADKKQYPFRISNGNLVEEFDAEDGRRVITWKDPFPKPSYLFAAVLGDFDLLEGDYAIDSERKAKLQVFVEKGKKERGEFSLFVLPECMRYDQEYWDRYYDLEYLKMVGVPDFNAGAMENKGLIIYNDVALLVDKESGTDDNFRRVAHVIFHEYAHNWSGNRVTVENWFELPLKESFTEFRSMLFMEHYFTSEFARIEQIQTLRERQFPDDISPLAHPVQMESYVSPDDNYDATTYIKGSEVFRMLHTILGEDFRKGQNAYFEKYDGQAVTFKELLSTLTEVCNVDLTVFERWFRQVGTPLVTFDLEYDEENQKVVIHVKQTCPHPKTGEEQLPHHIPIFLELIGKDGTNLAEKHKVDLTEREAVYTFENIAQTPIPLFLHGFSAPVKWDYDYSDEDLRAIILYTDDAFCRYEAGHIFAKRQLVKLLNSDERTVSKDVISFYKAILESEALTPLAKAQLLELPTLRTIAADYGIYDYPLIARVREQFKKELAKNLESEFLALLQKHPNPESYNPYSNTFVHEMKVRKLRAKGFDYLVSADEEKYLPLVVQQYWDADNFDVRKSAVAILANCKGSQKEEVLSDFHNTWKGDRAVLNHWMTALTSSKLCTVETLDKVRHSQGYDPKNPNHIRSVLRTFANNAACFHDQDGKGYRYLTDKVIEVGAFNPHVANSYIAQEAFLDYKQLPEPYQHNMRAQLERLRDTPGVAPRLQETAMNFLK